METHSLYVYCAFLTKGSVYASERSALYRRGQAISWHSYSKMGVSCLQQHVWISPPRGSTQRTRKDTTSHHRQAATVKADILFPFSSYYSGSFLSGCPHQKQDARHIQLMSGSNTLLFYRSPAVEGRSGVLTRQEGRLQVKRTGPSLVLRVSGSCCCLGLKLRLEPLVHFQTGSSLRQAPPTSNAPVGHSY